MRRVAGEEDAALGPAVGHAGVKMVDDRADDARGRVGAMGREQARDRLGRQQLRVPLAIQQLELEAPRVVRPRQRDAGTADVAEDVGVLLGVAVLREVDDQPALVEGGAAEHDAEPFAYPAAGAVAAHQIVAGQARRGAPVGGEGDVNPVATLLEAVEGPAEPRLDGGELCEVVAELLLQHGLAEGVAAGVAEGRPGRLDAGEAATVRAEVVRAVAGHDLGHHSLDGASGLHGAQRLIVDGHRAGFLHGGRVPLDEQGGDAEAAEQVGQREAGRATADDHDRHVRGQAHASLPRVAASVAST